MPVDGVKPLPNRMYRGYTLAGPMREERYHTISIIASLSGSGGRYAKRLCAKLLQFDRVVRVLCSFRLV